MKFFTFGDAFQYCRKRKCEGCIVYVSKCGDWFEVKDVSDEDLFLEMFNNSNNFINKDK